MDNSTLSNVRKIIMGGAILLVLGWLWVDGVYQYRMYHQANPEEGLPLPSLALPGVLLAQGLLNRAKGQRDAAQKALEAAAIRHEVFAEAWIELAKIYIEVDRLPTAARVLNYLTYRFDRGRRWDRPIALLAHHLGDEQVFWHQIRRMTMEAEGRDEVFQLVDDHAKGVVLEGIRFLDASALIALHQWLIRRQRTSEALALWEHLMDKAIVDDSQAISFAHYLLESGFAIQAINVWPYFTDRAFVTNPGFEKPPMGRGFGWRIAHDKDNRWAVRRIKLPGPDGNHVLEVKFAGKANLGFGHVFQFVPITPNQHYQLNYRLRGQGLTTDQRPFVEICRFDNGKQIVKSAMTPRDSDWQENTVAFEAPADCHVIMMRLRRTPSLRFDNKIAGVLQLDDFELVPLGEGAAPLASHRVHSARDRGRQEID